MTDKLTKKQPYIAAFTLLFTAITWIACRNRIMTNVSWSNFSTEEEIEDLHISISETRTSFLTVASFLWLSLILVLLHIYYMNRIFKGIFDNESGTMIACCLKTYGIVWALQAFIVCVIIPGFLVSMAYYSWEFSDGDGEIVTVGYYMQYLLAVVITEVIDAVFLAGGMILYACIIVTIVFLCACTALSAVIPWFVLNAVLFFSKKYPASYKDNVCCCECGLSRVCSCVLMICIFLIFFFSFCAFFDWANLGFWSTFGGSQDFPVFIFLSYVAISVWLFCISRKIGDLERERPDKYHEYDNLLENSDQVRFV